MTASPAVAVDCSLLFLEQLTTGASMRNMSYRGCCKSQSLFLQMLKYTLLENNIVTTHLQTKARLVFYKTKLMSFQ